MSASPRSRIDLVGMGPGSADLLTPGAVRALEEADFVLADARLLPLVPPRPGRSGPEALPGRVEEALDRIALRATEGTVAVGLSGDPGFYSLARAAIRRFGGPEEAALRVHPGISSLQLLAARLGRPWAGVPAASLHGREIPAGPRGETRGTPPDPFASALREGSDLAVLLGRPEERAAQLDRLAEGGFRGRSAALGLDLGLPTESVRLGRVGDPDLAAPGGRLGLLWIFAAEPARTEEARRPAGPSDEPLPPRGPLPDRLFRRLAGVPLSKAPVRALAAALLAPLEGARILEIGCGTGGTSAELARAAGPSGRILALEQNREALDLARENLERLGLADRIDWIEGTAPPPEAGDPTAPDSFDAVFLGGHGPGLEGLLTWAFRRLRPGGRLLLAATSPTTLSEGLRILEGLAEGAGGDREAPAVGYLQIAAATGRRLGSTWMPEGQNPVALVWADRIGRDGGGEGIA